MEALTWQAVLVGIVSIVVPTIAALGVAVWALLGRRPERRPAATVARPERHLQPTVIVSGRGA